MLDIVMIHCREYGLCCLPLKVLSLSWQVGKLLADRSGENRIYQDGERCLMNKTSFRECEDGGHAEKSEGVVLLLEKKPSFRGNKREGEDSVRRK